MIPTLQEGGQGCPGSRVEFRVVHLPVVNVVHDPAGDLLAEFHTPLVEGVYLPYSASYSFVNRYSAPSIRGLMSSPSIRASCWDGSAAKGYPRKRHSSV